MRQSELLKFYSKKEVAAELVRVSKNREVGVMLRSGSYAKRPDILQMPSDVLRLIKQGATSFHASEERWTNPLQLTPDLTLRDLDKLRSGFDIILDIDCKHVEWSKICAELLVKAIKWHEISSVSAKFSGGTGFHIAVPYEAIQNTKQNITFPDTPRIIAEYLKEFIKSHLAEKIMALEQDVKKIAKKTNKKPSELLIDNQLDPYQLLEIDTVLISSRHLFRMPYSLNEKKDLISLPLKIKDIPQFSTDWAKIETIGSIDNSFLNPVNAKKGEASQLIIQALDWKIKELNKHDQSKKPEIIEIEGKVPEDAFPPCIKLILAGLADGRKRAAFILLNFLKNCNWSIQEIEARIHEWNQKNPEPLKKGYLTGQINYFKKHYKAPPPPNCNNKAYYRDFNVCRPDFICPRIRNPLSYVRIRTTSKS